MSQRWRFGGLAVLAGAALAAAGVSLSFAGSGSPQAERAGSDVVFLPQLARDGVFGGAPVNTPTATPTLAAEPTPTPTGAGGTCAAISICTRKTSAYVDSAGAYHIVGEVVNNRQQAVELVQVTGDVLSGTDQLLATAIVYPEVTVLAPGTDAPFDVVIAERPPGIASYQLTISDFVEPSADPPVTGMIVALLSTSIDTAGVLHLTGTVHNESSVTYTDVRPVAALYGAEGNVAAVDSAFTTPDTLAPGETGMFDIEVFDPPSPIGAVRLWVNANQ